MTVLRLKSEPVAASISGDGMDRAIERKRLPLHLTLAAAALAVLLLGAVLWLLLPHGASETVGADRITVSTVRRGTFDDFLPLRARVTPLVTVYLDAVEGGRVDRVLVEDGAAVAKGQLLAVLTNADLQLSTLRSETDVAEQLNNLRTTELALARTHLDNERAVTQAETDLAKAKRLYDLQAPLAERGFVAGRTFGDTRDDFRLQQQRLRQLRDAQVSDDRLQTSQLGQLRATAASLQAALGIARANLDQLNLRAPVAGQLTAFSIQVGQSMARGERLGQIDSSGRNKVTASVDEYYLGRVQPGQRAALDRDGRSYPLKVAKIYPQVKNGSFEVDLHFAGAEPAGLQRGQTLQAKLTLGDPAPALLLPNGAFYNETGGAWVFVGGAGRPLGDEAPGPPRPPQCRLYRGARRPRRGRARRHLPLYRARRQGSARHLPAVKDLPMLTLRNLSRTYRTDTVETAALHAIDLDILAGEFVAVMGPSGCGKSTLLNILGLLDSPTAGSYRFGEQEVAGLNETQLAAVPQAPHRLHLPELQPGGRAHRPARMWSWRCSTMASARPSGAPAWKR